MINLAILGCGKIAVSMAKAAQNCKSEINMYACAARDLSRAEAFRDKFGFEKAYGSYEEMLSDESVDLVYVATPIAMHYDNVKQCLSHGKNVLCEKCFTLNVSQARELFDEAKARKLFIMEAVWTRFMPFVTELKKLLAEKAVGEIKSVKADFCVTKMRGSRNYQYDLGGGAMLDMGMYTATLASLVLGDGWTGFETEATIEGGVDVDNRTTLHYDGAVAYLRSSLVKTRGLTCVITGDKGKIELPFYWFAQKIVVKKNGEGRRTISCPFSPDKNVYNGYTYELLEAARCIRAGETQSPLMPPEETLKMIELFDALRREWGVVYACEK